ncbi:hypothetical protein Acor_16620 [Acrocarpospora corrugata]|uniref:MCE family protein n=1 Tax=Acrocarpospora corrugata TaxID=35763 RepID=A0A5M3VTQ2_9ACTN|nr:MCE family protein [Acrocarpospora corrugata]GER99598.1 hypothetical protein Acor_16620 [Acrocarpospora corrugata]
MRALVPAAVAALAVFLIWGTAQPGGTRHTAVFGHAGQGLDTMSPVKIRGITVGGVSEVRLTDAGRAEVVLRVDEGVRVPDDVTAVIEPSSVFGPKFVNLVPGAHEGAGPYLADGAVITRTRDPKDLSDSLGDAYGALRAVDPRELTVIVHTLGRGLDGKGEQLRDILGDTGTIIDVAHRHRRDARVFLRDSAALSTALEGKGGDIVGIAADTNAVLPDLEARAGQIRVLLKEISSIADLGAHGLRQHGGNLGATVNSGERAAAIVYRQLGVAGDGVRGLDSLLARLNRLIAAPGPDGTRQLGVQAFLLSDICQLFAGVCEAG